jgi:signal transduction histidine kinase
MPVSTAVDHSNAHSAGYREQLQALAERLRRAREEERTSVARDLHDQIGQILTAIKMDLVWITRHPSQAEIQPEIQNRLRAAIDLVNEGLLPVRTICSGLRPQVLDDLGLVAAIEWQAADFTARTGIACDLSAPSALLDLDSEQATASFRIFQECLTNITRHAEATSVSVRLSSNFRGFTMEVEDNGRGFDEAQASRSLGVLGMKERARACGGDLQIISSPSLAATPGATPGTRIVLRIPTPAAHRSGEVPCTS